MQEAHDRELHELLLLASGVFNLDIFHWSHGLWRVRLGRVRADYRAQQGVNFAHHCCCRKIDEASRWCGVVWYGMVGRLFVVPRERWWWSPWKIETRAGKPRHSPTMSGSSFGTLSQNAAPHKRIRRTPLATA